MIKDIAAVLAQVRQGVEVVVEHYHRAVAVIKPAPLAGRGAIGELREALRLNPANDERRQIIHLLQNPS